jgi:predicted TIM-barrel fold metal-dependent hydrolase
MQPDHFLAKRHEISEYLAVATPVPTGFVYVETDRYLPSPTPHIHENNSEDENKEKLESWAKEPIEEIRFLKRVLQGENGDLMKGVVLWAPFNIPPTQFQTYLGIAKDVAGSDLWNRVVGFRFLLQGKKEGEVSTLVTSENWLANIVSLAQGRNGKGWAFDVGVDVHRDGEQGLEDVVDMIRAVREREADSGANVRFILSKSHLPYPSPKRNSVLICTTDHLCKPPLSQPHPSDRYINALRRLAPDPNIFIKLSGALNEFSPDPTPSALDAMLDRLRPFLKTVHVYFPDRIMFGSDWPVCNVGGPRGEAGNWGFWREVVSRVLEEWEDSEEVTEGVWWRTGERAYGIQL